jgi:hypothetical protein
MAALNQDDDIAFLYNSTSSCMQHQSRKNPKGKET